VRRSYAGSGSPDADGAVSEVISGTSNSSCTSMSARRAPGCWPSSTPTAISRGSDALTVLHLRHRHRQQQPAGRSACSTCPRRTAVRHVPAGAVQVDRSHRCHARWAMRCRQDLISWSSRIDAAVVALRAAPRRRGLRPPGTRSRQPPPLLGANTGTKVNSQHALGLRRAQARPHPEIQFGRWIWSLTVG